MDLTTAAAGASAAFIIIATHGKVRKRRWWQRKFLKNGISYGDNLMSELLLNDGSSFRDFVRLTKSDFEELLRLQHATNLFDVMPPNIDVYPSTFNQLLRYMLTTCCQQNVAWSVRTFMRFA
ncbi:hypothetical protein QTP88_024878 [Uroleucon formosanum]